MAGVIGTGNHPKALWPGIYAWFGREYEKHPLKCEMMFDMANSSKKYEETVEATGFGMAIVKSEGGSISYDSETQGPASRFTHATYGLGYIVTEEELEDNLYDTVAKGRTSALAFSMRTTKETVAANVLNRAFNSSYTGGDGVELISTAHVTEDGTQSNELAVAADLSESSLEDLLVQISQAKNSRGLQIQVTPRKLLIAPSNQFEATRILKSTLQSGTANNDLNAVRDMGLMPEGFLVNHYFTDPDAWFVKTDAPSGLMGFNRRKLKFAKDNDFDTGNAKAKATERYSFGWTDMRGVYGSPGA